MPNRESAGRASRAVAGVGDFPDNGLLKRRKLLLTK